MSRQSISLFFFFQAEDGIRDTSVTGVQTCALPICSARAHESERFVTRRVEKHHATFLVWTVGAGNFDAVGADVLRRSEERRVGKKCRGKWGAEGETDKKRLGAASAEAVTTNRRLAR